MLLTPPQMWTFISNYWIIPLGMVALYYYGTYHFNSPDYPIEQGTSEKSTLEQARLLSLAPPVFTTYRKRYKRYAHVYVLILEVAFILLVFFSGLIAVANQITSSGETTKVFGEATKAFTAGNLETRALLALFALTGVLPSFPHIKNIDEWILKRLHQAALIPYEATLLAEQLYELTYIPTKTAAEEVRNDLKLRDTIRVAEEKATGSLEKRLLKMLWLRNELRRMVAGSKYARFKVALSRDIREVLMISASMGQDVRTYFLDQERIVPETESDIDDYLTRRLYETGTTPNVPGRDALIRLTERRELLKLKCDSLFYRLCLIAALMVLATERSREGTASSLQKLGFPVPIPVARYFEDWHAAAIVLATTAVSLVVLNVALAFGIWEGGIHMPGYTDRTQILIYSLSETAAYGVAMVVAIFGKRSQFVRIDRSGLGNITIAATTYVIAAAFYFGLQALLGHPVTTGPALFALAPAIVGYFIGGYIERARQGQQPSLRLPASQALCQAAVALIAAGFAPPPNLTVLQGISLDCSAAIEAAIVGLIIGILFQHLYKQPAAPAPQLP